MVAFVTAAMSTETRVVPASRECPLCGGPMSLNESVAVEQIPGNPAPTTNAIREWVCPACEHFEEVEEERA